MSDLPAPLSKAIDKLDDLTKAATGHGGHMQAETVRNYVRRIRKAMTEVIQPAAEATVGAGQLSLLNHLKSLAIEHEGTIKALKDERHAAAEALASAHTVLVHDARDWSLSSRDAWMYGLLVGWDDESLAEILAKQPRWNPASIARLKRLRAGIAAIYDGDLAAHKDGT